MRPTLVAASGCERPANQIQTSMPHILTQYGCGPVQFHGDANALYERHLLFDYAADPKRATARERFEAVARAVRDVLTPRWLKTRRTHDAANAKRVYYLSME